jgi:dipeptidyl aminopeptidase/acylaminoacyl peptidase
MRLFALTAACIVAVLVPFAAGSQTADLQPVDDFTKFDEFGGMRISPDGKYIAYLGGKYGRSTLAILDLHAGKLTGGVNSEDGYVIGDYHWVSPTRLIYFKGERQLGEKFFSATGEISAINFDGSKQEQIYNLGQEKRLGFASSSRTGFSAPRLVSTLRKDDDNILITETPARYGLGSATFSPEVRPYITRLNVHNGKRQVLERAPLASAGVLLDRDEQVRFAVGQDANDKLAVSWKPQPGAPWTEFQLAGFREESVMPLLFGADNQSVVFLGIRKGDSLTSIFSINLISKEVTKLHGFADAEVDDLLLSADRSRAVGVLGLADKQVVHFFDKGDPETKPFASLYKAFAGHQVEITSSTDDGRLAIVFVDSDVNPGDYYIFDTKTLKAEYLRTAKQWIDPEKMRHREPFAFKARDGLQLHGYVTKPAGSGPFPTVVLPHGGPHGPRDTWRFDFESQLLASRGYAVVQVNFRGSGGYGIDFLEAGYKEWGARMQDDVTDATKWVIEQKVADADKICIYGGSYGAYAALTGVIRESKLYRCAIGYAGVYDLELMKTAGDIPTSRYGRIFLSKALGDDVTQLRERSPVNNVQKIEVPLLIIHGKEDVRAAYEHAKRLKAALEKSGKQFEWLAQSGEAHGALDEGNRRQVYERILTFLDRHLKGQNVSQATAH